MEQHLEQKKASAPARGKAIALWCIGTGLVAAWIWSWLPGHLQKQKDADAAARRRAQAETAQAQQERQAKLNAPIKPRVLQIGESQTQMVVVRVPIVGVLGDIEHIRCMVWRDAELRTSTMSCLNEPESSLLGDRE